MNFWEEGIFINNDLKETVLEIKKHWMKTLSRGGIIVPCTTFKGFVCQAFSILELVFLKIIQ